MKAREKFTSVTVYFLFEVYAIVQFIYQEFDGT